MFILSKAILTSHVLVVIYWSLSWSVIETSLSGNMGVHNWSTLGSTLNDTYTSTLSSRGDVGDPNTDTLPVGWEVFCTRTVKFVDWNFTTLSQLEVSHMVQISCHLGNGNKLYFSDFRAWQKRTGNSAKVAIKVVCDVESGGSFHVPWPMKVENLVYFSVSGCRLPDYYSEYFDKNVTVIPDQLRVLEIRNCTAEQTISERKDFESVRSDITRDVSCGPLTAEKIVFSKFSTDLPLWGQTKFLCDFKYLRHIDESAQSLQSGKNMFFSEYNLLEEIRTYNLSNADMTVIPKELKVWRNVLMPKITVLDLSHNYLSQVEFYDSGFEDYEIGVINLQYNNVTQISKRDIDTLLKMKSAVIDLRHNPLDCSCNQLTELNEFLKRPDLGKYEYLRDIECQTPEHLIGTLVKELTDAETKCKQIEVVLIAVLTTVLLVLVVAIFILIRYRREVVILVYTRLHIVLPCQPVENSESKDFDAFISYSSMDDEWVRKTLVEKLENPGDGSSLRLCLHHRDFEIGAAITDNVVRSVESSRHTVMVLSRNFVQSEWCIYEFRTAMHQSLIEKKKHLIVIILEDVPKSELEPDLRKCLQTFTYIQVGERLFWDKLIYSLTRKARRKSTRTQSSGSEMCEKETLNSTDRINCNKYQLRQSVC